MDHPLPLSRSSWVLGAALAALGAALAPAAASAQDPQADSLTPADSAAAPARAEEAAFSFPPGTFRDERARELFVRARRRWLDIDQSILSYDAESRMRLGAYLRTPLRDRTLIETEAASRIHWSADSTAVVQYLGATGRTLAGPLDIGSVPPPEVSFFDPTSDRVTFGVDLFGLEEEDDTDEDPEDDEDPDISFGFEHPIAPGAEEHYRYQIGDSLTLTLPDGRSIRSVALELVPRERSGRLVSGEVWIEPESGAVVRALYRLSTQFDLQEEMEAAGGDADFTFVPGMFLPIEFDVSMVVIEYTLWDFEHWMPGRWRLEGYARAGMVRVPFQLDQTYRILDVVAADDATEPESPESVVERWLEEDRYEGDYFALGPDEIENPSNPYGLPEDGDEPADDEPADDEDDEDEPDEEDDLEVYVLLPEDPEELRIHPLLPPPINLDAAGFTSDEERREFLRELADLPVPEADLNRFSFDTGPELGELTRYNRVEGLALGARASWSTITGIGPMGAELRGWIGIGSGEPDVRLSLYRESPFHRMTVSGYHRVDEVEPLDNNLGLGNSLGALLWGDDTGEYFRATGARFSFEPVGVRRPWYRLTLSAEEHSPLPQEVDFTVAGLLGGDDAPFRPNLDAAEAREYSATVQLDPWWGSDPQGAQGGLSLLLQGAGGDFEWVRSRVVGRLSTPIPFGLWTGIEVGAGRVWGDAPLQRNWFLGGSRTLRGYRGSSVVGTDFLRGRLELSEQTPLARLSVFSDAAWAGARGAFDADEMLVSAGVGVSILEGLMRIDVARALRAPTGWRLELQMDAAF